MKAVIVSLFIFLPWFIDCSEKQEKQNTQRKIYSSSSGSSIYSKDIAEFVAAEYSHEKLVNVTNKAMHDAEKSKSVTAKAEDLVEEYYV